MFLSFQMLFVKIIFNLWVTHYPSNKFPFFLLASVSKNWLWLLEEKNILTGKILYKSRLQETDPQRHVQCLLDRDKTKDIKSFAHSSGSKLAF